MSKEYKPTITKVSLSERLSSEDKEIITSLRKINVIFGHGINSLHAVKDLSLNIYRGEILGLVGESGSGKTTTGNAIMGLIQRESGEIKILDREMPLSNREIKGELYNFTVQKTQMIFQDPANSLNPYKNIYKIVSEGLNNVDVKDTFMKIFDNETIKYILILLKEKKVEIKKVEKINVEKKGSLYEKNTPEELEKIIYGDILKEIEKNSELDKLKTYIKLRLSERRDYLGENFNHEAIKKKLVIDTLKSVGLSERILDRFPLEFSGGQQQRIGISRAVVLRPELLVADEPISALDVSIQAQVINIFNDLKKRLNLSILLIAHDLRMVEYISDRIAVMYRGVIVEVGTTEELVKNPVHPYTKSLLAAVPSIDSKKTSLSKLEYDPSKHDYENNKPEWFKVGNTGKRFVLGTKEEVETWVKEK